MAFARGIEKVHRYLTHAFPAVPGASEIGQFRLSREQVESYCGRGFLAGVEILDSGQILELSRRLEKIRLRLDEYAGRLYEIEAGYLERPNAVVFHFLGAWLVDEWFHDLIFSPQITVPVAQLLGTNRVRFWHDQVFYKPPHHPGVVPWHQDYSYWTRAIPPNHVTINIVLDDASLENGCIHYVPGSHKWGLLPKVPFDGDMDSVRRALPDHLRGEFQPVPAIGKAGQASFHHSHTMHGSFGNASDRPRRAVVVNYMGAETRCADGTQPLLKGVPIIPEGAIIEGDYFPIVLDLDGA
jgi:hypothetical protein